MDEFHMNKQFVFLDTVISQDIYSNRYELPTVERNMRFNKVRGTTYNTFVREILIFKEFILTQIYYINCK